MLPIIYTKKCITSKDNWILIEGSEVCTVAKLNDLTSDNVVKLEYPATENNVAKMINLNTEN